MDSSPKQIEAYLDSKRDALGSNLDELEDKLKSATDWRQQFQSRPGTLMGIAFGGGLLFAAMVGGRRHRDYHPRSDSDGRGFSQSYPEVSHNDQWNTFAGEDETYRHYDDETTNAWRRIKGALVGAATTAAIGYLTKAFTTNAGSEVHDGTSQESSHDYPATGAQDYPLATSQAYPGQTPPYAGTKSFPELE